jgi:4-hydroxy-3-polyprenylbenzoate decarboxylase
MKRLVIGVSGASGVIFAFRMLDALSGQVESHLIISKASRTTVELETDFDIKNRRKDSRSFWSRAYAF